MSTRKNIGKFRKNRVKTVKKQIIYPSLQTKGIKYTVEPMPAETIHQSIKGDVVKKYINGKLVKQKFVSDKKINKLIKKIERKFSKKNGGTVSKNVQPNQIEVSDKTTFSQSLKSGFGSGLGFAAAFELIGAIFDDN